MTDAELKELGMNVDERGKARVDYFERLVDGK